MVSRGQGEAGTIEDFRRELIDVYDREKGHDGQHSHDYEAKFARRLKRVHELRKRKESEDIRHRGYDRTYKQHPIKARQLGQYRKTMLPLDVLPEYLAYEQLGELHEPGKWRCEACGTLHLKTNPTVFKDGRIQNGCDFCGNTDHWLNRLDYRRI